ncbi:endonuclease/exonuclease/phosphatase family protein [uncultured Dokdonia sp.]|uniref:endonuclease/exonuclease/phosphatase family protein n=1 Tax=uncultured Dokdonia sp. TaxID=575653 RepID=UPI00262D8D9E|nr:endonuclease/exonuclease/phosphatase family protein [uncultured Dokdonia sp.]
MEDFFLIASILLIIFSLLPFVRNQHWIFRVPEFFKIQLLFLQIIASIGLLIFMERNSWFWLLIGSQVLFIIYHTYLLSQFTKFYKKKPLTPKNDFKKIKIISANIYQYNQKFERFKDLIKKERPDIFITIESNKDWEIAMCNLETEYPYTEKVTLENTYGMHLYAKIPFQKVTTHYFVSNDIPSIEAHFTDEYGNDFVVFSVHPPPPSPTEEVTSKERDGDLMSIAKRAKEIKSPVLVIGDFNTVAWSRIAKLFIKNSGLIDGRSGRGILASYHAKYWFFRAPLDLVFHSPTIFLNELKVLEYIGSDHFPISTIFSIDISNRSQEKDVEIITKEEKKETVKLIKEGIKEKSANRDF